MTRRSPAFPAELAGSGPSQGGGGGGGGGGTVTAVTGVAPIASSGGTTPAISIAIAAPLEVTAGDLTVIPAADGVTGSMSGADKTKLDGITAGAGVVAVTVTAPIENTGTTANPNIAIVAAADGVTGSMSGSDKTKLDGITAGATPSVLTSTDFAQAATQAIPGTGVFTSVIGGNLTIAVPAGGGAVVLLGSVTQAQSSTTAAEASATVFVDEVQSGGFSKGVTLGATLLTSGSVAVNYKTAPLAAGAHTVDLRVSSTTAGTAQGDLVALIVTN